MAYQNYYYPQQPQMVNPMVANQQARLQQMEQMYPQFQQQSMYQQQVQQVQQYGLNGRIVDNVSDVTINEVSSDNNNPSVFLKRDQSEIYLKKYNSNGLIETITYTQVKQPDPKDENKNSSLESVISGLQEQLNTIDEKLNKALSTRRVTSKKEVDAE